MLKSPFLKDHGGRLYRKAVFFFAVFSFRIHGITCSNFEIQKMQVSETKTEWASFSARLTVNGGEVKVNVLTHCLRSTKILGLFRKRPQLVLH